MPNLIIQPKSISDYNFIANLLKIYNIDFDYDLNQSKIKEPEDPELNPFKMFAAWKNDNITLKSLRKKTWGKINF
jgi:hypothetical protein